jgi:hypothetical protein
MWTDVTTLACRTALQGDGLTPAERKHRRAERRGPLAEPEALTPEQIHERALPGQELDAFFDEWLYNPDKPASLGAAARTAAAPAAVTRLPADLRRGLRK